MSFSLQIVVIAALCTVPFSYGMTSNVFRCTSRKEDFQISGSMALFQGVLVLFGFAGSMGFALGVGTMALVGMRMILENRKGDPDDRAYKLDDKVMILAMSLAASINSFILAIGLPAFVEKIPLFSLLVLAGSFLFTFAGIITGKRSGNYKLAKYAVIAGGTAIICVAAFQVYEAYFA